MPYSRLLSLSEFTLFHITSFSAPLFDIGLIIFTPPVLQVQVLQRESGSLDCNVNNYHQSTPILVVVVLLVAGEDDEDEGGIAATTFSTPEDNRDCVMVLNCC